MFARLISSNNITRLVLQPHYGATSHCRAFLGRQCRIGSSNDSQIDVKVTVVLNRRSSPVPQARHVKYGQAWSPPRKGSLAYKMDQ
jgi:hypothetical protein